MPAGQPTQLCWGPAKRTSLYLSNNAAFKALVVMPLLLWWICIAAGMANYIGREERGKINHILIWFDQLVFKQMGNGIPLIVMSLRLAAAMSADEGLEMATAWPRCLKLYVTAIVTRLASYATHVFLIRTGVLSSHVLSDHMLLAGMVMAILQAELACVVSDLCTMGLVEKQKIMERVAPRGPSLMPVSLQELLLAAALVSAVLLMVCVSGDMYFTAVYYHEPWECFATCVLGFLLFQGPVVHYLHKERVLQ